jgi:type II secretion system protein N
MNRALRLAGYVGWFLLCFIIAAVLMFPVAGLKPMVVDQAERALGKGKQGKNGVDPIVTIGELATSGLGIKAKRLQVQLASSNPDPGPVFDFDSLWVSASLLSLVSPNKTLQLDADLYKGDASAQITVNEKMDVMAARIEVDDVALATVPAFIAALGVPVEGTLDADIDLKIGSATEKDTQGKIAITIANLSIGAGRLTQGFPGGLELSEAVSLGTLKLRVPVDKGQGTIDFSQEGSPAVEFDVDGTMTLRGHLPQSRMDIDGWFRPTQAFLDKTPAIKSAIELGEKLSIPGAPSLTKAKDGEGRYHFLAKGILQTLRPQLARDSGRRSRTKAAPSTPSTPAPTTEPVAAPEPTPAPPTAPAPVETE